jgi:hypothetical protein
VAANSPLPYYPTAADAGLREDDVFLYGNINLLTRVVNPNKPNSLDTLKSILITQKMFIGAVIKRATIGIPTLSSDGIELTDEQSRLVFKQTGSHVGIFSSPKVANKYLKKLSEASGYVQRVVLAAQRGMTDQLGLSTRNYLTSPFDIYRTPQNVNSPPVKEATLQPNRLGDLISIPDVPPDSEIALSIARNLTAINVSYDITATTEVSMKLVDQNYYMMENNYFVLRRVIKYRGREYEVAVVDVDVEESVPVLNVKLRSRSVQRMKRDKTAGNMGASSGYDLAQKLARKYGLTFFGDANPSKAQKSQSVVTANTSKNDDSVWDVLTRTAGDNESACFEMDGALIYGSERFLIGKFGLYEYYDTPIIGYEQGLSTAFGRDQSDTSLYIPLAYLPKNVLEKYGKQGTDLEDVMKLFGLVSWPSFRSSENDPLEADGSCSVIKPNGCLIRPGHTVYVGPLPTFFRGNYLVNSVTFSEATNDPVEVSFKTPTKPESQKNHPTVGVRPGTMSFARYKTPKTAPNDE